MNEDALNALWEAQQEYGFAASNDLIFRKYFGHEREVSLWEEDGFLVGLFTCGGSYAPLCGPFELLPEPGYVIMQASVSAKTAAKEFSLDELMRFLSDVAWCGRADLVKQNCSNSELLRYLEERREH